MRDEEKRLGNCAILKKMLEHDFFITSLFACSVEIVLKSYDSQKYDYQISTITYKLNSFISRVFPWVLVILDLSAYHFYKVHNTIDIALTIHKHIVQNNG